MVTQTWPGKWEVRNEKPEEERNIQNLLNHVKEFKFHPKSFRTLRRHITPSNFHLDKNCDAEVGLEDQEHRGMNDVVVALVLIKNASSLH